MSYMRIQTVRLCGAANLHNTIPGSGLFDFEE